MWQFLKALSQKLTKGGVVCAEPLDLSYQTADDIEPIFTHRYFSKGAQMQNILVKVLVTGKTENSFYYRQEHEWRHLGPDIQDEAAEIVAKLHTVEPYAKRLGITGGDDGLVLTSSLNIDGKLEFERVVNGISYRELSKIQKFMQHVGDELVTMGERRADKADAKRGWDKRGK